jgi:hypothetical protein
MSGHLVTGVGPRPGLVIIGYRGAGFCRRGKPLCGCRVGGRPEREAGCGSRATGSELTQSALDSLGRTIFVADAHRGDGRRFVVRADDKVTAFLELESAIRARGELA